jgi:catechol 2,3-dioxygenase-like lactoylglutathione lyase family enzyme
MINNLRHFALCVDDLEKAVKFYCDLGGELSSMDYEKGDFIESLLGISGVEIKTCKLLFKDNSRMELIQFLSPIGATSDFSDSGISRTQKVLSIGIHHIAFTVSDLHETIKKVIYYGGSAFGNPVIPGLNHSVHAVKAKHVYMLDPFGNLLHLAQDLINIE